MTIDERRKYLRTMKKRYLKAGQTEGGWLLDEMEAVTGVHRMSLTRLMNCSLERKLVAGNAERAMGPRSTMPYG